VNHLKIIRCKEDFFNGYPDIHSYADNLEISKLNQVKVELITNAIILYKCGLKLLKKDLTLDKINADLSKYTKHQMKANGWNIKRQGGFYLDDEQIRQFENTGILTPFDVISTDEAKELLIDSKERHGNGDFENNTFLNKSIISSLKTSNEWVINYSGFYQALRVKPCWDLLAKPEISHRLASLLGNDVICWRSQFFEKKPNTFGTFWHQNSVFRETAAKSKLTPTVDTDPGMVQLTAWVALTDVTIKNGALRVIPQSFSDSRVEFLYSFIQDNLLKYMSTLTRREIYNFTKIGLFSTSIFYKAQAVFDTIYESVEASLLGKKIVDLEMKAGQAIIFTSLNMHGSFPNTSKDQTRLAFAGRFCANSVKIFNNMTHDRLITAFGPKKLDVKNLGAMQIHGDDHFGHNNIIPYGKLF